MLWTPQKGLLRAESNFASGGSNPGTAVTTGGAAGTKGSWTELIASTSFDAYLVLIVASAYGQAATASEGCLDIGIGAATEEVLIPDLLMGYCGSVTFQLGHSPKQWMFPLYIPAGSRLTARACGARTASGIRVGVYLWGGDGAPPFRVGSKITTYGVSAAPNGTAITPGASAAEGSWTQITAGTSEDHFAFFPSLQVSADTTTSQRGLSMDIGVGAATEEAIASEYLFATDTNEAMAGPIPAFPSFADVPSGTRLAARVSNNGTNDGAYEAAIHAVS